MQTSKSRSLLLKKVSYLQTLRSSLVRFLVGESVMITLNPSRKDTSLSHRHQGLVGRIVRILRPDLYQVKVRAARIGHKLLLARALELKSVLS